MEKLWRQVIIFRIFRIYILKLFERIMYTMCFKFYSCNIRKSYSLLWPFKWEVSKRLSEPIHNENFHFLSLNWLFKLFLMLYLFTDPYLTLHLFPCLLHSCPSRIVEYSSSVWRSIIYRASSIYCWYSTSGFLGEILWCPAKRWRIIHDLLGNRCLIISNLFFWK
jgi:hypothetical protein